MSLNEQNTGEEHFDLAIYNLFYKKKQIIINRLTLPQHIHSFRFLLIDSTFKSFLLKSYY